MRRIERCISLFCRRSYPAIGLRFSRIFFCLKCRFGSYMEGNSTVLDKRSMRFLPLFFDLRDKPVVLVGAGAAAMNKLRLLCSAGARVHWYADGATGKTTIPEAQPGQIAICAGDPGDADMAGCIAVVCATGEVRDDAVAALARRHNVPVNVVDRPDLSTFIFPAIVDRGEVVVAIATGGAAPVLARRLRERIEALLPARIG
ncbi:MAG: bifunctional precorrin-2 dehydrogenase/sirohydrochlorin ferrochelatase, partial [Xanthobacteraceae bacterium]